MNANIFLRKIIGCVLVSFFSTVSFAQTEEKTLNVDVLSSGAEARQEAFQQAVEIVSKELAAKRLGATFLNEHAKRFQSDVLSNSEKYVLSVKGTGSKPEGSGTRVSVVLSISNSAFDSVLRESGLLQLSRQNLGAVIFIEDGDRAKQEGPWWAQAQYVPPESKTVEFQKKITTELKRRGIEVLDSKKVYASIPPELRKANFNREDLIQIGKQNGASIVLFGLLNVKSKDRVIYHGQWVQVPAEKMLSEVQGEAKSLNEAADKFLEPVQKAQAMGTLNSKPFALRIRGELSPKELKDFKEELAAKVTDLRSIHERYLSRGDFSYEVESPQAPSNLVSSIQALSFKDFQLKASLEGEDQILLSVKKR